MTADNSLSTSSMDTLKAVGCFIPNSMTQPPMGSIRTARTWNPYFWESDELGPGLTSFIDEVDGLADCAFEVKPCGLGSDLRDCSEGVVYAEEVLYVRLQLCTW